MNEIISITIPGRVPSKKNSRPGFSRSGRIPLSKEYLQWERYAALAILDKKGLNLSGIEIQMDFFFPDNRRADLDNKITSVLDLLVKTQTIKDDSWQNIRSIYALSAGIDRERPRVDIWLRIRT